MRRLAVDGASDGLSRAEDLLDGAFQLAGHGALAHDAGDVDDLVEGDVAAVLNVLDLLAVTRRLLEGADEESGSAGNHAHRRLTILDRQLDRDAETCIDRIKDGKDNQDYDNGLFEPLQYRSKKVNESLTPQSNRIPFQS